MGTPSATALGGAHARHPASRDRPDTVVLDLDGTFVDSVYVHALVWREAFREVGIDVPTYRLQLLIADGVYCRLVAVPRGVMAAGNVMEGARGGVDLPDEDRERVRSHLAKYYSKMDDAPPWEK